MTMKESFWVVILLRGLALRWTSLTTASAWLSTSSHFAPLGVSLSTRRDTSPRTWRASRDDTAPSDGESVFYQRVFYRFTPGSDVAVPNAMVVEERCRFRPDPQRPEYIQPVGPRTLILRDGQVEDGEIGDDFFTLSEHSSGGLADGMLDETASSHQGAGTDAALQAAMACALYLASNPTLCQGRVLEIACQSGLASLLGCLGAGYTERKAMGTSDQPMKEDIQDDILTISNKKDSLFPKDFELLTLTDVSDDRLSRTALATIKAAGVSGQTVALDVLDWRVRSIPPRGMNMGFDRQRRIDEYRLVLGCDVSFSYPETKELARTVANRLQPTAPYFSYAPASGSSTAALSPLPRFVYVCPDGRDDLPYLRRILEKGYRMSTSTHYLKMEKLTFQMQKLPLGQAESGLDDLELEVADFKEVRYESLVAQHHPDYAGEGSGEMFFPIETGEYEATGGSTFLEKEAGSSPW